MAALAAASPFAPGTAAAAAFAAASAGTWRRAPPPRPGSCGTRVARWCVLRSLGTHTPGGAAGRRAGGSARMRGRGVQTGHVGPIPAAAVLVPPHHSVGAI